MHPEMEQLTEQAKFIFFDDHWWSSNSWSGDVVYTAFKSEINHEYNVTTGPECKWPQVCRRYSIFYLTNRLICWIPVCFIYGILFTLILWKNAALAVLRHVAIVYFSGLFLRIYVITIYICNCFDRKFYSICDELLIVYICLRVFLMFMYTTI